MAPAHGRVAQGNARRSGRLRIVPRSTKNVGFNRARLSHPVPPAERMTSEPPGSVMEKHPTPFRCKLVFDLRLRSDRTSVIDVFVACGGPAQGL